MKLCVVCCLLVVPGFLAAPKTSNASTPNASVAKAPAQAASAAPAAPKAASAAPAAPKAAVHHARLDVGFASYEKNMLDRVVANISKVVTDAHWTPKLQLACKDNVTKDLSAGLKLQLAEIKQSIGKTWMGLPEDDQKDAYVAQLRSAFEPVFDDSVKTIGEHLERSLKHVFVHSHGKKQVSDADMVSQCEATMAGNILNERCYDLGGDPHIKKAKSFLQVEGVSPKQFCMPSVFEAMLRRLKDSQGLIGMTMSFEAKSESLAPAAGALDAIVASASDASK